MIRSRYLTSRMSESLKQRSRGRLIANALSGSWRSSVVPPQISVRELEEITPLLIQAGAGALVWSRIRDSALADSGAAAELQQMYRLHRLEASVHIQRIKRVLEQFRRAGIEPVLVKGWNVARLYPEAGLRHYFDVDLCVAHDAYAESLKLVAGMEEDAPYIDLHDELDHLDTMPWAEFFVRTQMVSLCSPRPSRESPANKIHHEGTEDTEKIRVPCAEDHLRILCVHWLRHGAWKPAGLCDIAAAIETRPLDFDWQRCLGPDPVRAGWVACTVGLAQELLGAENRGQGTGVGGPERNVKGRKSEVRDQGVGSGKWEAESEKREASLPLPLTPDPLPLTPGWLPFARLPRWLVPAVLRQWSRSLSPNNRYEALPSLVSNVTEWRNLIGEIYSRLDQPVRATVALHGRFNNWPRWPYQLGELLMHSPEVPKQLATMFGQFEFPRLRRPDARQVSDLPTS